MKYFFRAKPVITNIAGTFTILALVCSLMAPLSTVYAQGQSDQGQEQSNSDNHGNGSNDNNGKQGDDKKDDGSSTVPSDPQVLGDTTPPTDGTGTNDNEPGITPLSTQSIFNMKQDNPHQEDVTGTITVCKVVLDADGNAITGTSGSTFSVELTNDAGATVGTATFNTPLTLDSDVISNIHGNDAQCVDISNLTLNQDIPADTVFHYKAETGAASASWQDPRYIEEMPGASNFPIQSKDLLTFGVGDSSDGNLTLSAIPGLSHRTMVVVNQMKAVPDVQTVTISATKIICPTESDLPNWSGGPDITATTATDFIATHPTCHIQSPWDFQWGNQNVQDMGGDYRGPAPADSGYTTFTSTTTIPLTNDLTQIRLREVLPTGYIAYTGTDNSAEFWCGSDVLNYDNWEWVTPHAGETINCVAFNVPTPPGPFENSCALPDSLGDTTAESINFNSGEPSLQTILNDKGYPNVNVVTDQKQYQVWNVVPGQQISVTTTFLDKYAGHGNVFGYYKNGDISTFVPLFKTGTAAGYESTAQATSGDTYDFSVPSSSTSTIGFAIKSFDGVLTAVNTTQNALNVGGADRAVVYNPGANTYVLGFEDTSDATADNDFNDVVVDVKLGCTDEPAPTPTKLKVHIFKYLQGVDSPAVQVPNDSTAPNFPMIATYAIAGLATNLNPGDPYVLGNGGGVGGSDDGLRYAANTVPMSTGDQYGTHEVTDGSVVVDTNSQTCPVGKYRLLGYKTGTTLQLAQDATLSPDSPFFSNLTTDEYVIVVNQPCPQNTDNGGGDTPIAACSDGKDNDDDGLIDAADPGCHTDGNASNSATYDKNDNDETNPVTPTYQCSDGIDNDHDGLIDSADPGCHSDGNASNNASYVATDNDETNVINNNTNTGGGSGHKAHHSSGSITVSSDAGQVLGATACAEYITSYIKLGKKNNADDVTRLQTFLNEYLGTKLTVTGVYDKATYDAVKQFQLKESSNVLKPWVGIKLKNTIATGWVYKTTRRWINLIKCPDLKTPMPNLTIDKKDL